MNTKTQTNAKNENNATTHYDTLIIGAGFGGLRSLHEMRELGYTARVFDKASDVGGTWYWNRYPGARTDTEAWGYCFDFSEEMLQEWNWKERMPTWDQVLDYFNYVADKFDMRKDIQFNTHIQSCVYNEQTNQWTLTTEHGETFSGDNLICASGLLSVPIKPPFKGADSFKGEFYMAAKWPKEKVEFEGKRVAIIGAGSTGAQILTVVGQIADSVTLFQRTPNYVMPGRNHMYDDITRQANKRNYKQLWAWCQEQVFAFPMAPAKYSYGDVSYEKAEQIFEKGWEDGGFRFLLQTFDDLLVDRKGNEHASEFVRRKIRALVNDPETAELLCPDYPFAAKRPPVANFYYDMFNRDNVHLVDIRSNAVSEITPNGVRLENGDEHEFDIIICAIGFDAATGALTNIDVRGKDGVTIKEKWANGPKTHLGMCVDGFPNMFMLSGPQTPFANIPVIINNAVPWIGKAIEYRKAQGCDVMSLKPEAAQAWTDLLKEILDQTLLGEGAKVNTWYLGANVPGKTISPLFYFGGAGGYFKEVEKELDNNFPGFDFYRHAAKQEESA